jgi:hypothetical protein
MIRAFLPSMTATHEFVVPKSIPMTLPITVLPRFDLSRRILSALHARRQIWFPLQADARRFCVHSDSKTLQLCSISIPPGPLRSTAALLAWIADRKTFNHALRNDMVARFLVERLLASKD